MTVVIYINNRPIKAINAVNKTAAMTGLSTYECWDQTEPEKKKNIEHVREDGAEKLARKMLEEFP